MRPPLFEFAHRLGSSVVVRGMQWVLVIASILGLMFTTAWAILEQHWMPKAWPDPQSAFVHGALGIEIAPLKYVLVMGKAEVSKDHLLDRTFNLGREYKDWVEAYGFIPNPKAPKGMPCLTNGLDEARKHLPIGFTAVRHIPGSAWPSPIPFAGVGCAACHSAQLTLADGRKSKVILGAGSPSVNVIAWRNAIENAIRDPKLTAKSILDAYDKQCGRPKGLAARAERLLDRLFIALWLREIRNLFAEANKRYGLTYSGAGLFDPANPQMAAGPGRTRPFQSVVRRVFELPGVGNRAISKLPATFLQNKRLRPRSQFDGSIKSPVARSLVAALTSGASEEALHRRHVAANVKGAASYTLPLDPKPGSGNSFGEVFPNFDPIRSASGVDAVRRGLSVYKEHCQSCHGHRPLSGGNWSSVGAPSMGTIVSLEKIGTDRARIDFRYAEKINDPLWSRFPGTGKTLEMQMKRLKQRKEAAQISEKGAEADLWVRLGRLLDRSRRRYPAGHSLTFPDGTLTYEKGYLAAPISGVYLRAPYLHNGSVPNLRQLIGLDERPTEFCRGNNLYDPVSVGLVTPLPVDGRCPGKTPFLFRTGDRGNSNSGHYYPKFAFKADGTPSRFQQADLLALLAYLKTL